jgi:hypothetical protein
VGCGASLNVGIEVEFQMSSLSPASHAIVKFNSCNPDNAWVYRGNYRGLAHVQTPNDRGCLLNQYCSSGLFHRVDF